MKLLTHNMLTSKCLKGVTNGFPLKIVIEEMRLTLDLPFFHRFSIFKNLKHGQTPIINSFKTVESPDSEANEIKEVTVEFNKDFIERIVPKMDWNVLCSAATQFGVELPSNFNQNDINEEVLKSIHHALLEIEIMDGHLLCPESGRKFPISQGIPNMLCNEDEV